MVKLRHLAIAVLLTVVAPLYVCAAIPEPIRTANGLVTGAAGAGPDVRVFKGLPYAAPPVGDLRWQPPQPAKNWDGVRAADTFSANCMQRQAGGGVFPPRRLHPVRRRGPARAFCAGDAASTTE